MVKEQGSVASQRKAMHEMGAHAVISYRSNVPQLVARLAVAWEACRGLAWLA